jgi:hypothetical protein
MRIQTDTDPEPRQTKSHKKLNFYMKSILKVGNGSKNILKKVKSLLKGRKPGVGIC